MHSRLRSTENGGQHELHEAERQRVAEVQSPFHSQHARVPPKRTPEHGRGRLALGVCTGNR